MAMISGPNPGPPGPTLAPPTPRGMITQDGGGDLLKTLTDDYKRLKAQKVRSSGGVEQRILLNVCFLNDEHYVVYNNKTLLSEPRDENKLYLSFNLIQPRFSKLLGRLSAIGYQFKSRPDNDNPKAKEDAQVVDRLIVALDEKLNQPARTWELLWWLGVAGTAFEYTPWIPNATLETAPILAPDGSLMFTDNLSGETVPQAAMEQAVAMGRAPESYEIAEEVQPQGEVGSVILGPLNVFIDQSTRSIDDLPPDGWVHIAQIKTIGWIQGTFGEDVQIEPMKDISLINSTFRQDGPTGAGLALKDLIPLVQGSCDSNDPPMAVVIESFQPPSNANPKGRYVCWVPTQTILHDGPNPYDEIPLVDIHWKPVTTNFWTPDYISGLIAPQRFINKRISQLGEQANASVYAQLLLGSGLSEKDIPSDYPGVIKGGLADNGQPLVGRLAPPELPQWFMLSLDLAVKMFNDSAGGTDLTEQSQFPGQLRGPMAVPMLQEILDTQWGPLYSHLGERFSKIKQLRLNRVKQFYPPQRTMHYTNRDSKTDVMTFHTEKILKSGTNFNVTVDRGSLLPELRALREARVSERLAGPLRILYMDERTGKIDKSKVAADIAFGDTGREDREAQYRKLAQQIIEMLWKGQPVPPVLPFYDHSVMLDELEHSMATMDFLKASQGIQVAFNQRWQAHQQFLQQEAQAQQAAMQSQQVQTAVAQATQQAAAMAAADTVHATMSQIQAGQNMSPNGVDMTKAAFQAPQNGPLARPPLPQQLAALLNTPGGPQNGPVR